MPLTSTGTATAVAPAPAGGATNGSLGYLSIRTSVTGTAAPLVPATGTRTAAARSEPPPARPPAGLAAGDITGAVRPPADVGVSPRILSVQKALAKLGYGPLKIDGRPGARPVRPSCASSATAICPPTARSATASCANWARSPAWR